MVSAKMEIKMEAYEIIEKVVKASGFMCPSIG
jgi:hypothetical protein